MQLQIASFQVDVSPEIGQHLCGGMVDDAKGFSDAQYARGVILDDGRQRVVLCAVDYCELGGRCHEEWRTLLAHAAGTVPARVTLHTVHQHDAPFLRGGAVAAAAKEGFALFDEKWWGKVSRRLEKGVRQAAGRFTPVTAVGAARAKVRQAAGNRRIIGANGELLDTRWSICGVRKTRNQPEGVIDPWLRTISFWGPARRLLATLNYYASHPQSAHGRGIISADVPGEALRLVSAKYPGAQHCYFTGCEGNVTFGKYSTPDKVRNIRVLGKRLGTAMLGAIRASAKAPSANLALKWKVVPLAIPFRMTKPDPAWRKTIADSSQPIYERAYATIYQGGWLDRQCLARQAVVLFAIGGNQVVHLPGEVFVEYQLFGQELHPDRFIAFAALGECSVGYVPTAIAFKQGGYEPSPLATFTTPAVEKKLKAAIARALA